MSLYSDYDGYFEESYPFGIAGDVWHSYSGDIRVSDMTNSHIRACMRIVGEDDAWYWRFQKELNRREALKRTEESPCRNSSNIEEGGLT